MAAQRRDADWRKGIAATDSLIEDQLRRGSAALRLLREGREATLTLAADMACPARARLARSTQKNAFADGRYVIMTTAMLPFFHSDDEAAVAMAHELAHNILGHPQRLKQQGVATGFFRHFGKNASRIRATEVEADRLSIRLLAAAGYDLTAVIPFWTRLERGFGGRFQINTTHPGVRARTRMLKEEIDRLSGAAPPPVPSGR
jgi:predicted Zn-dependent protease